MSRGSRVLVPLLVCLVAGCVFFVLALYSGLEMMGGRTHPVVDGFAWATLGIAGAASLIFCIEVALALPRVLFPGRVRTRELRAELVARMDRDQQARSALPSSSGSDQVWLRIRTVDVDNTAWLRTELDRHGWPRRGQVGTLGAQAAWLIAQHADLDLDFQRRCLALLTMAVADGQAVPAHLAYLTDRVLRAEGKPQRYGTQFWNGPDGLGPLQPQPIENAAHLDERRQAVGLEPFADYERRLTSESS